MDWLVLLCAPSFCIGCLSDLCICGCSLVGSVGGRPQTNQLLRVLCRRGMSALNCRDRERPSIEAMLEW